MAESTLLFDLDGTLWDSYKWYARIFEECVGTPTVETEARLRSGHNVIQMAKQYGLSNSRLKKACQESADDLALYQDVPDVLRTLHERGTKMGIVTNVPERMAEPLLANFDLLDFFSSCIYAARKPAPTGILRAMANLNLPSGALVTYVGDSQSDAVTAHRAKVDFAWASYGYSDSCPPETMFVLDSFADVLEM